VSFTELWTISREFIFLTLFSIFLIEILIAGIIFKFIHKTSHLTSGLAKNKNQLIYRYNIKWLIIGAVTLITFYTILLFSRTGQIIISVQDEQNLLLLISAWGISTLLTNRYKYPNSINHYYEIAPYIKASIIGLFIIVFFYFSLRLNTQEVRIIMLSILIHSCIEVFYFYLYFFGQSKNSGAKYSLENHFHKDNDDQKELFENVSDRQKKNRFDHNDLVRSLQTIQLNHKNQVVHFISNTLVNDNIHKDKVSIFDTISTTNIKMLYRNSQDLIVNIHNVNNLRRINHYFINSHDKLSTGGLLVGSFIPLENFYIHLRGKMPHFLYAIMLPFHFIFHRVFPKLAITKQIYFILTGGKIEHYLKLKYLVDYLSVGLKWYNMKPSGIRFISLVKKQKQFPKNNFLLMGLL